MKDELQRRQSHTDAMIALFRSQPWIWIGIHALAHVGGFSAWRTRVADARKVFRSEGGDVIWNRDPIQSAYCYRPQAALGRDASTYTTQKSLF